MDNKKYKEKVEIQEKIRRVKNNLPVRLARVTNLRVFLLYN